MPILLAIEPDRRQAAHLTAIVRHQVGADLVIADTTEGALDAIGNRVPDLVLVPALLSPQDDAALAAALRVIAAAAHVRTLTIPVLANGVARASTGGMLAKWRKGRAASPEPDGCDPAVFGEQITAYLKEAAAERAELEADLLDEEPVQAPAPVTYMESVVAVAAAPIYAAPTYAESTVAESTVAESIAAVPVDGGPADAGIDPDEEPLIDLSEELAELEGEVEGELFDGEEVGVYTIPLETDGSSFETFDLLQDILEPVAAAPVAATPAADIAPEQAFVEPAEPPRADIERWVPMYLSPGRMWPALEGVPAEMPVARSEQPDWIELVASLRQDLERRRTDPVTATDPIAARPSDGAHADSHRFVKKPRVHAHKAKPVQDEWGFFDPEQCGFSTLLAKLDEITEA